MRVQSFGLSHKGHVRQNNDDCFAELLSHSFFVLADGIGSLKNGGMASRLAVQHLLDEVKKNSLFSQQGVRDEVLLSALESAIINTHNFLWRYSQEHQMAGLLGTTLVSALFSQDHCLYAHIGDSRIYLLRGGRLELLSQDDSLVFELLHYGLIDEAEVKTFPLKHIITKSLGGQSSLHLTCHSLKVEKGDLFLLCSDGLSGPLDASHLREILIKYSSSLQKAAHALQEEALSAGGFDNITSLLIHVL